MGSSTRQDLVLRQYPALPELGGEISPGLEAHHHVSGVVELETPSATRTILG
jgi:hypothetical protein